MVQRLLIVVAASFLLTGCVFSQKAHDIQIRLSERSRADLETAQSEIIQLGKAQTQLDGQKTAAKLQKAYVSDMTRAVAKGSVDDALTVVKVRDQKTSELRDRLLSKAGKYDKIAGKLARVGKAIEGMDEISNAQNSATTEVWTEFLKNDLPGIAAKGLADIGAAQAAKNASANSDGTDPASDGADPTSNGDSGDPTDTTGGSN